MVVVKIAGLRGSKQMNGDASFVFDEQNRTFWGWLSVEVRDREGEIIPMDVLRPMMDIFMRRGGFLILNHSNWVIGRLVEYEFRENPETNTEGLFGKFSLFSDYPIDNECWEELQNGGLDQLSIAGDFEVTEDGVVTWIAPMEVSVTGPAVSSEAVNQDSNIVATQSKSRAWGYATKIKKAQR